MLISPCFFFLSTSASVVFVNQSAHWLQALHLTPYLSNTLLFIAQLVPYCLFWFFFTFLYLFMPNRQVPLSSAFLGGVIGGTIYLIVQWGYIYFQIAFNRVGAIYGSFAAFPLFLIWVQLSWFFLLFGAEISFAHQTLDQHEYEERSKRASVGYKRLLSLWILHLAIGKFMKGEPWLTRDAVMVRYQIPYALATPILDDLVASGLLVDTSQGLAPVKAAENLRISDALSALETRGISDFPFIEATELAPFERSLLAFREQIESSPENKRIYTHSS
jgi:membrane protein